jgi:hypothetical protein
MSNRALWGSFTAHLDRDDLCPATAMQAGNVELERGGDRGVQMSTSGRFQGCLPIPYLARIQTPDLSRGLVEGPAPSCWLTESEPCRWAAHPSSHPSCLPAPACFAALCRAGCISKSLCGDQNSVYEATSVLSLEESVRMHSPCVGGWRCLHILSPFGQRAKGKSTHWCQGKEALNSSC